MKMFSQNKKNINKILRKIDDVYKNYKITKYFYIISSKYQTKDWRKNQSWYKNGKKIECEKFQIRKIEKILNKKLIKTNKRINMETNDIINIKSLKSDNGYEYTETFDGYFNENDNEYYFNLKFICDSGGAQTRSLREVYHFVKHQLKYIEKNKKENTYFINILDGDTCFKNMNKFNYLLNKEEYKNYKKYIYVGDLYTFKSLFIQFI